MATQKRKSRAIGSIPDPKRRYFLCYGYVNEQGRSVILPLSQAPSSFQNHASNIVRTLGTSSSAQKKLSMPSLRASKQVYGDLNASSGSTMDQQNSTSGEGPFPL